LHSFNSLKLVDQILPALLKPPPPSLIIQYISPTRSETSLEELTVPLTSVLLSPLNPRSDQSPQHKKPGLLQLQHSSPLASQSHVSNKHRPSSQRTPGRTPNRCTKPSDGFANQVFQFPACDCGRLALGKDTESCTQRGVRHPKTSSLHRFRRQRGLRILSASFPRREGAGVAVCGPMRGHALIMRVARGYARLRDVLMGRVLNSFYCCFLFFFVFSF